MSQSRFSIVLVGVSALLRRPLVSRLRPADGERSSWVVFAARGCRFESGFRSVVGLRVHRFRFSACTDSGWPLGEFVLSPSASEIALGGLAFGLTASAFRYAPLRGCRSASWFCRLPFRGCPRRAASSAFRFGDCPRRVGLRAHCFRFSACAASEWLLGEFVLPPSASEIPLDGLVFGFTASAFRHAPIRSCPRRVGLRAHCFRFSARADSEWPLGGWPSGLLLRRLPFGGLAFGLTVSAFRHAPLRSGCWASSFFRLPLRKFRSAGWPSGSLLPLFGTHRFGDCPRRVGLRAHCFRFSACADPHRRAAEARTDGAQRHDNCFTSKHLSQHVNLPHRTP